jgi:hypothetical protein
MRLRKGFGQRDSREQARSSRSLAETMAQRATVRCEACFREGIQCVGGKGHAGMHWAWDHNDKLEWKD